MTTELQPAKQDRPGGDFDDAPHAPPARRPRSRLEQSRELGSHARQRRPLRKLLADNPAWPLTALLGGFPLWWALGIGDFMFIILAVPMAARLVAWHTSSSRRLRLPPGFSIWLLYIVCMLAGVLTMSLTAPGTAVSSVGSRYVAFADRALQYLSVTVLLVFAGNLTEKEYARKRLAWLLGLVGVYAVIGGFAGIIAPHFQFTSPMSYLIPRGFQSNTLVQSYLHPGFSQVQGVLGTAKGRPKAPFNYTDSWGESLVILVPFLLVAWNKTRNQRRLGIALAAASVVPLVYSLDRGAWIGAAFAIGYAAFRLATRGRLLVLGGICGGLVLATMLILLTPLHSMIATRLTSKENNSNSIRSTLDVLAVKDALASPWIGYGDTRHMQGSPQSIAVGPTSGCYTCGQLEVGSTGQLWLLLISDGIVGSVLFYAFFGYGAWRYWRDRSPTGMAGVLVLLLSFVFMFFYSSLVAPLGFTMVAYALLWRNDQHEQESSRDGSSGRRPERRALFARSAAPATPRAPA
jgi:hypothetical protein